MSKSKKTSSGWTPLVVFVITGGFCLFLSFKFNENLSFFNQNIPGIFTIAFSVLFFMTAWFIQRIIQIFGFFVFGHLCGYTFCSLKLYNLILTKENGKIRFKSKSGIKKQIVLFMLPPKTNDGKHLVIPYILGGAIANILSVGFFLLFFILSYNIPFVPILMLVTAVVGLYFAITQLLPFGYGYNSIQSACLVRKNPDALRCYDITTRIYKELADGVRLKNMPNAWFEMPDIALTDNAHIASNAVFVCSRYMDCHSFDKASETAEMLLEADCITAEHYQRQLISNKIYCEILNGNSEEILKYMTEEQIKYMAAHSSELFFLRTRYAYALLCENDSLKAEQLKAKFENTCSGYLFNAEAQMEQELMEIADKFSFEKA